MGNSLEAILINENKNYKAVVVAIARQHPGETVGSWMMEGFIKKLREIKNQDILWIIIPMINVDGVILGNNRTGLLGLDFNRNWNIQEESQRQSLFPEVMASSFGIYRDKPVEEVDLVEMGSNILESALEFIYFVLEEKEDSHAKGFLK
ncbi:unnamed protein product [Sphagnum balticum]